MAERISRDNDELIKTLRLARAIQLFYLPEPPTSPINQQYLVLEMHGGPEYTAICTDMEGK